MQEKPFQQGLPTNMPLVTKVKQITGTNGACKVSSLTAGEKQLFEAAKAKYGEEQAEAENLGIPTEKLREMRDYAVELRRKFPHMKPDRLKRKVAEHFKIKLV